MQAIHFRNLNQNEWKNQEINFQRIEDELIYIANKFRCDWQTQNPHLATHKFSRDT